MGSHTQILKKIFFIKQRLLKASYMFRFLTLLERQFDKMVKHTQTIHRQFANNSSAICRQIVWACLTILWDWRLKG